MTNVTPKINYPDWFMPMVRSFRMLLKVAQYLEETCIDDETQEIYDSIEPLMEEQLAVLRTVDPFDEWDRADDDGNDEGDEEVECSTDRNKKIYEGFEYDEPLPPEAGGPVPVFDLYGEEIKVA